MKTWMAVGLLVVGSVGCKKKEGAGGGGGGGAMPKEWAAWMPKDAEAQWQGAWATRMSPLTGSKKKSTSMAGDAVAVEVKGKAATVTDTTVEAAMEFALKSPCEAQFTEAITEGSMKGGKAYHEMIFVIQNGALVVGSGAGGYRKGKAAIVCSEGMEGGVTIVDDKGECTTWADKFGKVESKKNTCAWSQADGKDVLSIGTGDWSTKVTADGDVLMSDQFKDFVKYTKKAKDYADAKAITQGEVDGKDPSKLAIKAGGEVGKTDTIKNFQATWGTDKSLKGKPFEITAKWLNSNTMTSNGETTYNGILTDEVGKDFTLACDMGKTKPPELTQGDKVIAKGTVDEMFDKPELKDCTVTKAP